LPEDFQQAYDQFLALFEERAVPYYESRDI